MAIAVASTSTLAFGTSASLVITKPTGLAVGDLMVAHIVMSTNGGTNQDCSPPAGWISITGSSYTPTLPYMKSASFYIVATSTETAASDFTFTIINQPVTSSAGAILRITGAGTGSPISASTSAMGNDSASISFAGLTPDYANSMLILLGAGNITAGNLTISGYAVATSNPSWTEQYDYNHAGNNICMSCATALRPEITATGNTSFLVDSGPPQTDIGAQFIIIRPAEMSVSATVISTTVNMPTAVASAGSGFSATAISVNITIQVPSITTYQTWANQSKNAGNWSNLDKH